ncbi:hypothetical protein DV515_00005339 [Chloebia gouldiae]|uniref:Uncharacterized protein n=1 Tax=Chloebia gouldiae TaxID=44316 RepID=A0A3L8SP86_CHLGU|nr:hypothetical protein DV515_00005339 [Chloebia gouldiae]
MMPINSGYSFTERGGRKATRNSKQESFPPSFTSVQSTPFVSAEPARNARQVMLASSAGVHLSSEGSPQIHLSSEGSPQILLSSEGSLQRVTALPRCHHSRSLEEPQEAFLLHWGHCIARHPCSKWTLSSMESCHILKLLPTQCVSPVQSNPLDGWSSSKAQVAAAMGQDTSMVQFHRVIHCILGIVPEGSPLLGRTRIHTVTACPGHRIAVPGTRSLLHAPNPARRCCQSNQDSYNLQNIIVLKMVFFLGLVVGLQIVSALCDMQKHSSSSVLTFPTSITLNGRTDVPGSQPQDQDDSNESIFNSPSNENVDLNAFGQKKTRLDRKLILKHFRAQQDYVTLHDQNIYFAASKRFVDLVLLEVAEEDEALEWGEIFFFFQCIYTPVTQTAALSEIRSPSGDDQVPH